MKQLASIACLMDGWSSQLEEGRKQEMVAGGGMLAGFLLYLINCIPESGIEYLGRSRHYVC